MMQYKSIDHLLPLLAVDSIFGLAVKCLRVYVRSANYVINDDDRANETRL